MALLLFASAVLLGDAHHPILSTAFYVFAGLMALGELAAVAE